MVDFYEIASAVSDLGDDRYLLEYADHLGVDHFTLMETLYGGFDNPVGYTMFEDEYDFS